MNTILLFWQVGAALTHGAKHLPAFIIMLIFYSWIISILLLIFRYYKQTWKEIWPYDD